MITETMIKNHHDFNNSAYSQAAYSVTSSSDLQNLSEAKNWCKREQRTDYRQKEVN